MELKTKKSLALKEFDYYLFHTGDLLEMFSDLDTLMDFYIHCADDEPINIANKLCSVNVIKKILVALESEYRHSQAQERC